MVTDFPSPLLAAYSKNKKKYEQRCIWF